MGVFLIPDENPTPRTLYEKSFGKDALGSEYRERMSIGTKGSLKRLVPSVKNRRNLGRSLLIKKNIRTIILKMGSKK
jgi:hypothetical protein